MMVKRFSLTVFMVLVLAITTFMPAYAQDVQPVDPINPIPTVETEGFIDETPEAWFVELNSKPTIDGTSLSVTKAEKRAFRDAARRAGVKFTERMAFDTLWNGLSIKIDKSQISALALIPGVKAIYPVDTIAVPVPFEEVLDPDLYTALAQTGADVAQSELGFTGAGIKVAVMDTGLDYDHPAFGGDGVTRSNSTVFPTTRVVLGWDFVGDDYNADSASAAYQPVPHPDAYPDDCNGHGTHVSGIVGANDATNDLKGVAPGVTFGAYRVFGCAGSTESDIMLAAMEMALADGMDVLNMSIGSAFQWPQYPTAVAADRLVNKGMVVVASIGNSGASGLYSAGAPGLGQKVIGVAAFDNSHVQLTTFTISPDNAPIGYIPATAAPAPPTSGTYPMARTGTPASTADACTALPAGSLTGKVALIRRGTCTFHVKSLNAQNAGAVGVVLYNNVAGFNSATVAGSPPITIPVVTTSNTFGALIDGRLAAGSVDMTWTDISGTFVSSTGNLISSFSSYGLAPDLSLKPDIGAPGGNIYSTFPLELGGYGVNSGTSMSSPHVAGAVALLLEAHPDLSSQDVRGVLQNSADPKNWWSNPGLGFPDNVHRQGAGMLDIDDAILATTVVTPAKIATGESQAGPFTQTLTVSNFGSAEVTYTLSHLGALSTGPNTFTPAFMTGFAAVGFSAPSVTVPAGGSATIDVTITANPGLADRSQYGGYVKFTPEGGGLVYTVPYGGFKGDYQAIQVLTGGFPFLTKQVGPGDYTDVITGPFTMVGNDIPYILVHLNHQSRQLKMEVFDAVKGKAWHSFVKDEYLPRNATATGFFAYPFGGQTVAGNKVYTVPDGTYVIKLSVLKALGDASNPAHWEYWTSPAFTIDRP
jgi:subtilisin family serine protease